MRDGYDSSMVAVVPKAWLSSIYDLPGFWPAEKYGSSWCPVREPPTSPAEVGYLGGVHIFDGEILLPRTASTEANAEVPQPAQSDSEGGL